MFRYEHEHDLNSPQRTLYHRDIILNKAFLRKLYREWYTVFQGEMKSLPDRKYVELHSGDGFLKDAGGCMFFPLRSPDKKIGAGYEGFAVANGQLIFLSCCNIQSVISN